MNAGYVTFVNRNDTYLRLTNILVDSVLEFSKYPIEVFGINFDYDYLPNESRIIRRRFDVNKETFQTICLAKTYSSFNSSFDVGLQCDADMIITPEADIIFDESYRIINYPLGSLHPHDPNNQSSVIQHLNIKKKTQPYLHATYLFNKNCKEFFQEAYDLQILALNNNVKFTLDNYDETAYNVILWKYEANNYLDTYDPYYEFFVSNHINNMNVPYISINPLNSTANNIKVLNYYICHGCKNPNVAEQIFNKIKKLRHA